MAVSAGIARADEAELLRQRLLYRETLAALRSGDRQPLLRARDRLRGYPLYPYLELEDLRRRITTAPDAEVESFLQRHDGELPAARLRENWLATLEARGRWAEFLHHYDAEGASPGAALPPRPRAAAHGQGRRCGPGRRRAVVHPAFAADRL